MCNCKKLKCFTTLLINYIEGAIFLYYIIKTDAVPRLCYLSLKIFFAIIIAIKSCICKVGIVKNLKIILFAIVAIKLSTSESDTNYNQYLINI